jgi:PAS domain S-box-containing protein
MHELLAPTETKESPSLVMELAECRAECERLRLIMDNAPVLLAYVDTQHRYRYANAAYARRFGGSAEVLGQTVESLLGGKIWGEIQPYRERVLEGEPLEYEVDVERPSGERQRMYCVLNPARDASNRVVGYVVAITDVTDRQRVAEARDLLAAIVDSSDDAIVSMTLDGRVTSWNTGATQLFGYAATEMLGHPALCLSPPPEEHSILDRISKGERIRHLETVRFAKDGRRLDISLSAAPMRDHTGRVVGVAQVARDITESKAAEAAIKRSQEALRDADRRKDEFLALLAHELRNPLAPLVNAVELLRPAAGNDASLRRIRDMMARQLTQLQRLVDDLLDVSRISRGCIELRHAPVPLARALESAIESCQSLITARKHTLTIDVPHDPVLVEGDFARLAQVFANLISNSVKYTEPGGHIDVAIRKEDAHAVVSVRDTGIGIPIESVGTVFDMFSQVEAHRLHAGGGLGIGLALVRSLVEMHSGTVQVESEGPGTGSTFTVRLPLLRALVPVQQGAVRENSEPLDPQARRILIADDNIDAAASLALLLQMQGHETRTANNGRQAVELAETFRPDIIFMDLGMPQVDGIEATRQIRAEPWGKAMVIVALTGWGQESNRRQTREVGMDLHLVKPINLEGIAAVLAHT